MAVRQTKDGRTIRTGKDYTQFRLEMWLDAHSACYGCGRSVYLGVPQEFDDSAHVHHLNGRGMGGSKRDDTVEACILLCGKCHRKEHNQQ